MSSQQYHKSRENSIRHFFLKFVRTVKKAKTRLLTISTKEGRNAEGERLGEKKTFHLISKGGKDQGLLKSSASF